MPKRIRREPIYIAPDIIGSIQDDGSYLVIDEREHTRLDPTNVFDKIIIYERQNKGWFLEPTLNMVLYKPEHKGFLVLMSCLSYIEATQQYIEGRTSIDGSRLTFIRGINRIYPGKYSNDNIGRLYQQARCGIFHNGMTRGQIIISTDFADSITFTEEDIKINPKKFIKDLIYDFNNFIHILKTNEFARDNFNRMFSNIN